MLPAMKTNTRPWIHLLLCLLLLGTQGVVLGGFHQSSDFSAQTDSMNHHGADCPQGMHCDSDSADNSLCGQLCQLISGVGHTMEPLPPLSNPQKIELPIAAAKERLSDYFPPVEHGPPRPWI